MKIPLIKQPKNSSLCGPSCLAMIYSYYKTKNYKEEISKINSTNAGSFISDLGISLIQKNFDVTTLVH